MMEMLPGQLGIRARKRSSWRPAICPSVQSTAAPTTCLVKRGRGLPWAEADSRCNFPPRLDQTRTADKLCSSLGIPEMFSTAAPFLMMTRWIYYGTGQCIYRYEYNYTRI